MPATPPDCTAAAPAPRVAAWDLGGTRSDDGWNRAYAHPGAVLRPEGRPDGAWTGRCPACGASFRVAGEAGPDREGDGRICPAP